MSVLRSRAHGIQWLNLVITGGCLGAKPHLRTYVEGCTIVVGIIICYYLSMLCVNTVCTVPDCTLSENRGATLYIPVVVS